jgi:hypothetical protein
MPQQRLPAGVPLDVLQELIKASESGNFGGYNALAWHKNYNPNAMERPRNEYGFPVWEGSGATGRTSHGAGAYQLEPTLWQEFAPGLGVGDFSPESQDRVAAAALARYGIRPWQTNPRLQTAIADYRTTGRMPAGLVPSPAPQMAALPPAPQMEMAQSMPSPDQQMASLPQEDDPLRRYNLGFGSMGYDY